MVQLQRGGNHSTQTLEDPVPAKNCTVGLGFSPNADVKSAILPTICRQSADTADLKSANRRQGRLDVAKPKAKAKGKARAQERPQQQEEQDSPKPKAKTKGKSQAHKRTGAAAGARKPKAKRQGKRQKPSRQARN